MCQFVRILYVSMQNELSHVLAIITYTRMHSTAFDMGPMKLQSSQGWAPRIDGDPFPVGASYLGVAGSNTGMGERLLHRRV